MGVATAVVVVVVVVCCVGLVVRPLLVVAGVAVRRWVVLVARA